MAVLPDERRAVLEPLVEACRPKGKVPPRDLRRMIEAVTWRCRNGARTGSSRPSAPKSLPRT